MNDRRKLAAWAAEEIAPHAGIILVLVAGEAEGPEAGRLEIDAAIRPGVALTELGGMRLLELSKRLSAAVERVTQELTEEWGLELVDRTPIDRPPIEITRGGES